MTNSLTKQIEEILELDGEIASRDKEGWNRIAQDLPIHPDDTQKLAYLQAKQQSQAPRMVGIIRELNEKLEKAEKCLQKITDLRGNDFQDALTEDGETINCGIIFAEQTLKEISDE